MLYIIKNIYIKKVFNLLAYNKSHEALKLLDRYGKLFSHDTASSHALGYVFSQLDLEKLYNQQLTIIASHSEGTAHLNVLKASHFADQGDYEGAIEELNLALEIDKNEPAVFNNLGYYQSKLGLYQESIPHFDKAIELNKKFYFAYDNRGYSKLMLGEKSSIKDIRHSLKKYPNNAVALKNLALWEMKFGDNSKISSIINKAKSKKFYHQVKDELMEMELL